MIGGIGTVDHRGNAELAGGAGHLKGQLAILQQAHLGQEIEIVLAHREHIRANASQRGTEIAVEGRIEKRDLDTRAAKRSRGDQAFAAEDRAASCGPACDPNKDDSRG